MPSSSRRSAAALLLSVLAACSGGKKDTPPPPPPVLRIAGAVTGEVAAGVTVTLGGQASAVATTDAWGRFAFEDLAPGTYTVTPSLAGYAFGPFGRVVTLAVAGVAGQGFVASRSTAAPHAISGTLSGADPAGVAVVLSGDAGGATLSDASGRYAFTGLPDGTYAVRPSRSGSAFTPASAAVALAGADVAGQDFVVTAAHTISGKISGSAVAGVSLALSGATTRTTLTDANGAFSFANVADGAYTLTPSRTGYAFAPASASLTVGGGDVVAPAFTVGGAYRISGTVSVANAAGVAMTLSGMSTATTVTDASGAYAFDGVAPGTYVVTPSRAGYAFNPASTLVGVSSSSPSAISFTGLAVTGGLHAISGQITGVAGTGVRVALSGSPGGISVTATTQTDRSGQFTFPSLASGTYTVTPSLGGFTYSPANRSIALGAADVTGCDFANALPATTLSGTVTYAGARTGRVFVKVIASGGVPGTNTGFGTSVSAPGAFTIRGIPWVGTVAVMAWMDTLGIGRYDAAADPFVSTSVSLTPPSTGGVTLALVDPAPATPAPPGSVRAFTAPGSTTVTLGSVPLTAEGFEAADRYTLYWSDDASAPVGPAHYTGKATVQAASRRLRVPGLAAGGWGGPLLLAATSSAGGLESEPALVSPSPLPLSAPAGDRRVQGQVAFPPSPGGTVVVTASDPADPSVTWSTELPATISPQGYSLALPSGRYLLRAYVDVGNDGFLGPADPSLLEMSQAGLFVDVGGTDVTGRDLAIPSGGAVARVSATKRTNLAYQLRFDVSSNVRVPVTAAVVSGPNVQVPFDLGVGNATTTQLTHFTHYYDLWSLKPSPGDTYEVLVTYADGTSETLTASIAQVLGTSPTAVAPIGPAASLTPTFTWSPPSTAPSGEYTYVVGVTDHAGSVVQISPQLPRTQTAWTYDGPPLAPGATYDWYVQVNDASSDTATSVYPNVTFTTP